MCWLPRHAVTIIHVLYMSANFPQVHTEFCFGLRVCLTIGICVIFWDNVLLSLYMLQCSSKCCSVCLLLVSELSCLFSELPCSSEFPSLSSLIVVTQSIYCSCLHPFLFTGGALIVWCWLTPCYKAFRLTLRFCSWYPSWCAPLFFLLAIP